MLGWSSPITGTGKSSLVPRGPWIYGMTGIGAHYNADPNLLRKILPKSLEPTGQVLAYIVEIISQSRGETSINHDLPDLVQYNEAAFFLEVRLGNEAYAYCPFMYVDTDLALMRGILFGFPKKMGKIVYTKLHPMLHGEPRVGLRLVGYVSRSFYSLVKLIIEIGSDEARDELPLLDKPMLLSRYFPQVAKGLGEVRELVSLRANTRFRSWVGLGSIEVNDGPNDELGPLRPIGEVTGYYFHMLFEPREATRVGSLEP
jgi:hypothetical protein